MKRVDAILATLTYSDHFSYPLTIAELHTRLIKTKTSKQELITVLAQLLRAHKVEQVGEYLCLPSHHQVVALRQARQDLALPKLARAKYIAALLARLPTVLAVFVTGSLAVKNAKVEDDIDFMIITEDQRLWSTRLAITLLTEILRLRRRPFATQAQNKVCLNLYLSPSSLRLPKAKRSLYTAYELIQALPVYDPNNLRAKLLTANSWIHEYVPNVILPRAVPSPTTHGSRLFDFIESQAYRLQKWYMQSKLTREYITPHAAFFHPSNPGSLVLQKIKEVK